jgi:hypothetical protein
MEAKKATEFKIKGGVIVSKIRAGLIDEQTRMRDGFVILKANGTEIKSIEELNAAMSKSPSKVLLEGFYPGYEGLYQYPIELVD